MRRLFSLLWILYAAWGLLLITAMAASAASWFRTISVEWAYQPPIEPAVDSFVLYQGQGEVCRWDGADTRTGECQVIISAEKTTFWMAVMFEDGTYSPRSADLEFVDAVNAPLILKITR